MKTKNKKHRSKGGKKKTKNTNPAEAKPIKAAATAGTDLLKGRRWPWPHHNFLFYFINIVHTGYEKVKQNSRIENAGNWKKNNM
jgi:hypothetical protein